MGYEAYITRYSWTNKNNTVAIRGDGSIPDIINTILENYDDFDKTDIDSWCSNGRYWMDFIYDDIDASLRAKVDCGQYIVIRTAADYAQLCAATMRLMETAKYQFGKVIYAMNDRHDDGSFRCILTDGVVIQCEDGTVRHIWDEYDDDGFLVPTTSEDQFTTVQQFVRAVLAAADTHWGSEFLILGGSY